MSNSPLQTKLAAQDLYERGEIKIDVVHLEEIYSDLLGDEQLHFLVAYHFLHTSLITRLDISKLHSTISNDVDQLSHDIPEHPFVGIFNLCMEVMSTWSFNNYCNLTTLPSDKQLKEFQQKDEKLQSWAVNSHPRDRTKDKMKELENMRTRQERYMHLSHETREELGAKLREMDKLITLIKAKTASGDDYMEDVNRWLEIE